MRRSMFALLVILLTASACTGEANTTLGRSTTVATTPTTEAKVTTTADTFPVASTTTSTLGKSPPLSHEPGSLTPGVLEAHLFVSGSGTEIEYLLYAPKDYEAARSWPLIISLHGFLGSSPSLDAVAEQNPIVWVDPGVDFPFLLLAPLVSESWSRLHEPMVELVGVLAESVSINPEACSSLASAPVRPGPGNGRCPTPNDSQAWSSPGVQGTSTCSPISVG